MRFVSTVFLALVLSGSVAAKADRPLPPDQSYIIFRDGARIGSRTTRFHHDGDDLVVETATDIKVTVAFITAYERTERQKEVWHDGRLVTLISTIDDDGEKYEVEVARGANGLEVVGRKRRGAIPEDALPATYWNPATVSTTRLIDIKRGKVLTVETRAQGQERIPVNGVEVEATKYALTGDRNMTLWYDPAGNLLRLQLTAGDGSDIVIRPRGAD